MSILEPHQTQLSLGGYYNMKLCYSQYERRMYTNVYINKYIHMNVHAHIHMNKRTYNTNKINRLIL